MLPSGIFTFAPFTPLFYQENVIKVRDIENTDHMQLRAWRAQNSVNTIFTVFLSDYRIFIELYFR